MSSLFERDTKSLVKVLGRKGELVPVDSLTNALLLRPFCLVRKKRRRHPWPWDTPIIPTEYSLLDVLEPGTPEPEVSQSQPFHIQETGVGTGALEASSGLQRQLTTSNKASRNAKLAVQTLSVSPNTWEALVENRKVRVPQPSFLKNWEERENLYVVTEAVETVQDKTEGTGQSGHPKVQGQVPTEKVLSIPQGSIMAYRVLRLVIKEDRWGSSSDRALDQQLGFGGLQKKLGAQLQDLATLSPELRLKLLGALQELLRTPKALQELEDSLEKALDKGVVEQLGGPGGLILSSLQDPAGSLPPSKNTAILCILGALVGKGHFETQRLLSALHLAPSPLVQSSRLALVLGFMQGSLDDRRWW
ncbi:gasdermin-D-like [Suncus etruscus]|uniref:gasdermin-D-like n=1 Tax=Suncus etruscus TaxID=109475 RepID=UPI0021100214|nr:gasdermin-D-like [Suncus etruscus]